MKLKLTIVYVDDQDKAGNEPQMPGRVPMATGWRWQPALQTRYDQMVNKRLRPRPAGQPAQNRN